MIERRPYKREPKDVRREDMVKAALDLIAEGGQQAATVRAIADRAGVTPGLIRHYFVSKDVLVLESYRLQTEQMIQDNLALMAPASTDPVERLNRYLTAALSPPLADSARVGLWAGYVHNIQRDPALREIYAKSCAQYRDLLRSLIEALPRSVSAERIRADTIACNGMIDGLWMDASLIPELFDTGEILRIALQAMGAILGVDLAPPMAEPEKRV